MIINYQDYHSKVLGCWMGKIIGGTLGAPYEWKRQINNVSFYTQDLKGESIPNDDLDLQLLWLIALEEIGIDIDSRTFAEYWLYYVTPHWAEYGHAKANLRAGLLPPYCGTIHNDYKDSCGAFIRSEIWACITPGCPDVAARYAYNDAVVDHGNGEGTFAEIFCAVLESSAFIERDIRKLIEIALTYIPEDSGIARAVQAVTRCFDENLSWQDTRDKLLNGFQGAPFSVDSGDSHAVDGIGLKRGWDAPSNIGIIIIALLFGQGSFEKSICTAVNCGEDTDCTAATVGSILGLINGIENISSRWIDPIGKKIKTMCLNMGELVKPGSPDISQIPVDIDDLSYRVERIARQVLLRYNASVQIGENATNQVNISSDLLDNLTDKMLFRNQETFRFAFFEIGIDYIDGHSIQSNSSKRIILSIENKYKFQETFQLTWYMPENFCVHPAERGRIYIDSVFSYDCRKTVEFTIMAGEVANPINRFVIELTVAGRHTVMLVPIIMLNGNF